MMMSRALWHRHWIDTVGGLFVAVPVTLIFCGRFAWYFERFFELPDYLERYRTVVGPLFWPEDIVPFAAAADPRLLMVWETHARMSVVLIIGLVLFIHGSGIRSNNLFPGHPSIYYNLSLPVSRTRLVLTRYLMSALCALVLMLVLLLSNSLVALLYGFPLPMAAMLQTTSMATLALGALLAIVSGAQTISETAGGWVIAAAVVILVLAGDRLAAFVVGFPASGARAAILVAITCGALACAVIAAHKRDF